MGNRLSKAVQGGSTVTYTYDEMDRISSASGLGFDWDGNGNMVYKHDGVYAWNYTFDALNRLKRVEKDGGLSALYTYDAGGRRVRSWDTVDGSIDYVYSGLSVIDEVCGGVHERHIYAGGMHIASNTTGTIQYYHVDHLGSTRLKTNSTGGVVYESNYEPFGVSSGESGDEDYRYTGKPEDTTGLYYFGARYYDPDTGRFITRDTVFGSLSDPQSQNRYVYCRNNPQKYVDPDGECHIIAGAVIGAGLNVAFYFLELSLTGGKLDRNALIAKAVAGAVSGAIGAALPFSYFASPLKNAAVKMIVNAGVGTVETVTEMVVYEALDEDNDPNEKDEQYEILGGGVEDTTYT